MPYYVGGAITERAKLLVTTPERLRERFRLDVRVRSSVEAIDRSAKSVRVRDLATGREYNETYDKLILAPGAAPLRPPIPGIDLPGVFTLRNLQDVDRIKGSIDDGVKQAVIVAQGLSDWSLRKTSSGAAWRRPLSSFRIRCFRRSIKR